MSKQLYQRSFQLAHYMVIKYTDQATLYNLATSLAAVQFSTQMSIWAIVTWSILHPLEEQMHQQQQAVSCTKHN